MTQTDFSFLPSLIQRRPQEALNNLDTLALMPATVITNILIHTYLDIRGKLEIESLEIITEVNPSCWQSLCLSLKLRKCVGKAIYLLSSPGPRRAGLHKTPDFSTHSSGVRELL